MVIINFCGGLGNQMFQYSLYKIMKKENIKVKADIHWFSENNLHNGFELEDVFNIKLDYATQLECYRTISDNYIYENIKKYFSFQKNILDIKCGYLKGYWQNEKYFNKYRDEILSDFKFSINDKKNCTISQEMSKEESVSIHIRRGDYLSIEDKFGGIATLEYYNKAIKIIKERLVKPKFYIFSDDLEWTRNNLKIENCVYIDFNRGKDSYKDMYLMSKCKHNIIANSTFSWWGAWLNQNKEKIVIVPERMWNIAPGGEKLFPDNWIKCKGICEKELISETSDVKEKFTRDRLEILNRLYKNRRFAEIEKLKSIDDEYVDYYIFRIGILEDNYNKAEVYFQRYYNKANKKEDNNLFLSSLFHFAKYNYDKANFEKAGKLFSELDSISNGQHIKAKEYLNKLKR